MTETQVSELLIKGLMSDMPKDQQAQAQELLEELKAALANYPETVRVVAMAFISIELAKM